MLCEDPQSIKTNRLSAKVFLRLLGWYTLEIVTGVPSLNSSLSSLSRLTTIFSFRALKISLSNLFTVFLVTNFFCNLFYFYFYIFYGC